MEAEYHLSNKGPSILVQPHEILHHIFRWLCPKDVLTLKRVCRMLNHYVKGNQQLFRHVYFNLLVPHEGPDPKWEAERRNKDWESQVKDLAWLEGICHNRTMAEKERAIGFVSRVVDQLLQDVCSEAHAIENWPCASRTRDLLADLFSDESNQQAFLQRSFLFERVHKEHRLPLRFPNPARPEHQLSAKLHCLYGGPILCPRRLRSSRIYPFAVSKVYDLRQYTIESRWGPFKNDGSDHVDWEKMEAILIVLGFNLQMRHRCRLFIGLWGRPFSGSWPRSSTPALHKSPSMIDARDPYGINGTWLRVVCFLDHNDFWSYNFPTGVSTIPSDRPRLPLSVGEATRLIVFQMHVTSIQPPGPDDGQQLPVVHFTGKSRALLDSWDPNAYSELQDFIYKGTVRLTREGEVRWSSISVFHGQEHWRSEGIQVGGVGSARGVLGTWFDRDYDRYGPVGPTAFWKISDSQAAAEILNDVSASDFLFMYTDNFDYLDDTDLEDELSDGDDDDDEQNGQPMGAGIVSNEDQGLAVA